jgi:G3E family GTPase
LIQALHKLSERTKNKGLKLDGIVIEMTGMADPAPVAQTFFVDEEVRSFARLDGIIALVDAKHIEQHLEANAIPYDSCRRGMDDLISPARGRK